MRLRPYLSWSLAAWIAALASNAFAQTASQPMLPTIPLSIGIHTIQAELAATPDQRASGLMFRESMADNGGMLFRFDEPAPVCMWMRNTVLPLSVAFIAADGAIVNVEDMTPRTETPHCAAKPVRWALEMNRGWFSKRGLSAGKARVSGLPNR